MSTSPKIKVVQYMYGNENTAYEIVRKINAAYCQRHGYEHIINTSPPRTDRARTWEKIPVMREELHDCDYLLFMDADAFFYCHELTIEEELLPLLKDKQMMKSADFACEGLRHQPDHPNSGVILIRNSEKAAEMLKVWDASSERPELEHYRFNIYHEQEAFWRAVLPEFPDNFLLLREYYLMNGFCGIFIRHLMGMPNERRCHALERFLETHPLLQIVHNNCINK